MSEQRHSAEKDAGAEKVPHLYERDRSKVHVCTCGQSYNHTCHDPFRAYEPRNATPGVPNA